jgi:hypothetical protein
MGTAKPYFHVVSLVPKGVMLLNVCFVNSPKIPEKQRFQRASPLPQELLKNFSTRLNKV